MKLFAEKLRPFACLNWADVAAEYMMHRFVFLPLEVSAHRGPIARIIGLFVFFVWAWPAFAICALPLLALIFASIIIETWKGDL